MNFDIPGICPSRFWLWITIMNVGGCPSNLKVLPNHEDDREKATTPMTTERKRMKTKILVGTVHQQVEFQ